MAKKTKPKAKAKAKAKAKKPAARKSVARPKGKAAAKLRKVAKKAAPKRKTAAKPKRAGPKRAAASKPRRPEVPEGYSSVTAYLVAQDAAGAIAWYAEVFGAREVLRMPAPGDKIGHAELVIGDTKVMLCDEFPEMNARSPLSVGGSPVTLMLYVDDVDDTVELALARGGTLVRPVQDQFYGDRSGTVTDPQGHVWHISTHVEDVPDDELMRRMQKMMGGEK